ncbi:MAG: pirin family protein [Bdellovibrionales bacterium]|nr:pirin family protein [Bdellovibrionales bacterium]
MEGLQAWVALPKDQEECDPSFQHYNHDQIPTIEEKGVQIQLVAGSMKGKASPVKTSSPLTYAKVEMKPGSELVLESGDQELAFYLIQGSVETEGQAVKTEKLIVFEKGSTIHLKANDGTLGVILGGIPLPEKRLMFWNFVATTPEKLESAKRRWKERRFDPIPGETEFIPLPE